ncbi:MAG: hypothetical protein MJZ60_08880 [Bacteroidaceae bacterium]|nr:hypothetical protein [Bacteroidaceae bacterium]
MKTFDFLKENERCIERIQFHEEQLSKADNNHKYITALHWLRFWLQRFSNNAYRAQQDSVCPEIHPVNNAYYLQLFTTGCGFSFYARVNNSITAYEIGERPF